MVWAFQGADAFQSDNAYPTLVVFLKETAIARAGPWLQSPYLSQSLCSEYYLSQS
jgi:hypothetical protein